MAEPKTIFLTGATGYLGGMLAARILASRPDRLLLPVRSKHSTSEFLLYLRELYRRVGGVGEMDLERLVLCPFSGVEDSEAISEAIQEHQATEILHCAACIDFLNQSELQRVNIDFTRDLTEIARRSGVERFVYLSSSFSCGYLDRPAEESLHAEPPADPTFYTKTKRQAERLVASSGLPYLIVRPSLVIGNSVDGSYTGKPFGIYQMMNIYERLMCDAYVPSLHVVAPPVPIQVIHEDSFVEAFFAAYDTMPNASILHLSSRPDRLPNSRDLWKAWLESSGPEEIHYYRQIEDVPLAQLEPRLQTLMEFARFNIEISSHPWDLRLDKLETLRSQGLKFNDATRESVCRCMEAFIAQSPKLQSYIARYRDRFCQTPRIHEH